MLRLAGRYGDMCFIPPWIQAPFAKVRSLVDKEAHREGRQNKLVYGAGSPTVQGGKFDLKMLEKNIQAAA
jgi:hypothetical protein